MCSKRKVGVRAVLLLLAATQWLDAVCAFFGGNNKFIMFDCQKRLY